MRNSHGTYTCSKVAPETYQAVAELEAAVDARLKARTGERKEGAGAA